MSIRCVYGDGEGVKHRAGRSRIRALVAVSHEICYCCDFICYHAMPPPFPSTPKRSRVPISAKTKPKTLLFGPEWG